MWPVARANFGIFIENPEKVHVVKEKQAKMLHNNI
jgi:hypothetical protein